MDQLNSVEKDSDCMKMIITVMKNDCHSYSVINMIVSNEWGTRSIYRE